MEVESQLSSVTTPEKRDIVMKIWTIPNEYLVMRFFLRPEAQLSFAFGELDL